MTSRQSRIINPKSDRIVVEDPVSTAIPLRSTDWLPAESLRRWEFLPGFRVEGPVTVGHRISMVRLFRRALECFQHSARERLLWIRLTMSPGRGSCV